jgi:hypothetical protein
MILEQRTKEIERQFRGSVDRSIRRHFSSQDTNAFILGKNGIHRCTKERNHINKVEHKKSNGHERRRYRIKRRKKRITTSLNCRENTDVISTHVSQSTAVTESLADLSRSTRPLIFSVHLRSNSNSSLRQIDRSREKYIVLHLLP